MSLRRRVPAIANVTLCALKRRIRFLFLELQVENSVGRRFDVAAGACAATGRRLSPGLRIQCVERRDVVTTHTTQARVWNPFVTELCGVTPAPPLERLLVLYSHRRGELRVEIIVRPRRLNLLLRRQELMARGAIRRGGLQPFRRVTGKTYNVRRSRLKRALLEPERIIRHIFRRLGYVLVIGVALRLVSLMADSAALRITLFGFGFRLSRLILGE